MLAQVPRFYHFYIYFFFLFIGLINDSWSSPWGKNYFPNTELVTHEGKKVRFFDHLIENKIVAVNFIYTSCPDTCPLETAQLVRVQNILGERLGKDIHFYSISIDPEHDTPQVLSNYRKMFKANWTFLTGNKQEIVELRKKLGLYIDGIDNGPNKNNHNVSMIIGNQKTGRWMKRSPFENPYVLADQLGNWLDGWRSPPRGQDYASAPKLRELSRGEQLFRTRCESCHTTTGIQSENALGPDLVGVTGRRSTSWLINWIKAPDKMIQEKDPIALALLKQYNNLPMPNMRLNRQETLDLIDFLATLNGNTHEYFEQGVSVSSAWVRETHEAADVNAGYMTIKNVKGEPVTLIGAYSDSFEAVELHEMAMEDGMMAMRELREVTIDSGESLIFKPHGKHLMLKKPKRRLVSGDNVVVSLQFSGGVSQTIIAKVKKVQH